MAKINEEYLRSTLFGIEDGLVSTTGLIAGISAGTGDKQVIVLAGLVAVAVEALSMGAGEFLSDKAVHELDPKHKDNLVIGALLMFISYFLAGMIPVLPILLFPITISPYISILFALISLFVLGYVKGKIIGVPKLKSALEILIIGGLATIIGFFVGRILKV